MRLFEREMLSGYTRPRGISRLTMQVKQCSNQPLHREGPAGKSMLENCPTMERRIGCGRCSCQLLQRSWVCTERAPCGQTWVRPRSREAAAPSSVLRRIPRVVALSEGSEDAETAAGKAGKPSHSEGCSEASSQPGGQLPFQTPQLTSVSTSCRRNEITQLCSAQLNELKVHINVPTPCCNHVATRFSEGAYGEACQQQLQELPNHHQITCRCNYNAVRDYASA